MKFKHLSIISFSLLFIFTKKSHSQNTCYWQQRAEYNMVIQMDEAKHQFSGTQSIQYFNNSPDTLRKLYYHLYFNAFQPGSSMDVRSRLIPDPDRRVGDRISKLSESEIGYQKIKTLNVNGKAQNFTVQGTILEVKLDKPILPKTKATLNMEFEAQVPIQIRRSGRNSQDSVDYSMAQWYPKLCEYDPQGWHTTPYIGREFYGVWGDFDVTIYINKNYVIGATGVLQNPLEVGHGYEPQGAELKRPQGDKLKWNFVAKNVHDFAWAADRDYKHDVLKTKNGPIIHFIYQNDKSADLWKKLQPMMEKFFDYMAPRFGKYPYEHFSFIQGGDGGMEYPMMTLITSRGNFGGLVGVAVHEAIHNWFYGVLATNESKYPWMDEGFTEFATDEMMNLLFEANLANPHADTYAGYLNLWLNNNKEPLTTHADFYHRNSTYGASAYSSGAVFLHQLSYVVGKNTFYAGMLRYFNEWKFKHPTPDDFLRVMERVSDIELDWYMEQFIGTMNKIDYGVKSVIPDGSGTKVIFERVGDFPMPLDIHITYTDGKTDIHYIPLDIMRGSKTEKLFNNPLITYPAWPWVYTEYEIKIAKPINQITMIKIDPTERLADANKQNNQWPQENKIIFKGSK